MQQPGHAGVFGTHINLRSGMKEIAALAAGLGVLVLAIIYGVSSPASGSAGGYAGGATGAPEYSYIAGAPDIRVAVQKDATSIRISGGSGGARVLGVRGTEILSLQPNATVQISGVSGGFKLDNLVVTEPSLTVESAQPQQRLRLNGDECAAQLGVVHSQKQIVAGKLTVVARLNLEVYLAGVLTGEVPVNQWHPEALKAQAITSRTFAVYEMKQNAAEPYDVEATVKSQVFKPSSITNPAIDAALQRTRGLILTYEGEVMHAYFHSTCGGHTDPCNSVFAEQPAIPPLSGTVCPYCSASPHYRWKTVLLKAGLEQKLRASYGSSIGTVQSIDFYDMTGAPIRTQTDRMRRATLVRIKHSSGTLQMQGNQFRLFAGAHDLKSMLLSEVVDKGSTVEIYGGGFGHGIGLCQYGSQMLAQSGGNYLQILGLYYPHASLTKMY